jgi:DNA-binding beta-propeller fold protein YncE
MLKKGVLTLLIFTLTAALVPLVAAKVTYKVLYKFTGGTDGGSPSSRLTADGSGNLYGTTSSGGDLSQCGGYGCGTVFKLMHSAKGQWQETVLYAFHGGSDGSYPSGNLVFDNAGNLYGTTFGAGNAVDCTQGVGCGTVFELSPQVHGSWTKTTLYTFQSIPDGAYPAGLTFDASGKLYGTTAAGGSNQDATAYVLSPPTQQGGAWTKKVLFDAFVGTPNPVLIFDDHGNLYGSYYSIDVQFCGFNCGAVFELEQANGNWTETDLHVFYRWWDWRPTCCGRDP